MDRKVVFFDIDGTLTSEIDGSIPNSVKDSISQARSNGHLMFINTGRTMQNVEARFRDIGFDGYICGCGTNIYVSANNSLTEILHIEQPHSVVELIYNEARKYELDLLFESKHYVCFDTIHDFVTAGAKRQYQHFVDRNYDMSQIIEDNNFTCDKFVIWFKNISDLSSFRKVSDTLFDCIDRGGNFREFVPHNYSKATGIQKILDYYNIPLTDSYAFGDSNNDLSMLSYVNYSIAMGNSTPSSLLSDASFATKKASEDGIYFALSQLGFLK